MTTDDRNLSGVTSEPALLPKQEGAVAQHHEIEVLRKMAFGLNPVSQHRLAFFIAENIGMVLVNEPEHPDSPHAETDAVAPENVGEQPESTFDGRMLHERYDGNGRPRR